MNPSGPEPLEVCPRCGRFSSHDHDVAPTALEELQAMEIAHRRSGEDFYSDQANRAGDVLWEVIKALDVAPIRSANETVPEGDTLIFGMYLASDVIEAARRRTP